MLTKIIFFVIAVITATAAAVTAAGMIAAIGYLADMPTVMIVATAATIAIASFGITTAVFALAASLFFTGAARPTQ